MSNVLLNDVCRARGPRDREGRGMNAILDRLSPEREFYIILSEKISRARWQKGLSQAELGAFLDVSHVAVHNWESGKRHPDPFTVHRLEQVLGVKLWP